jgi:alkylation response protein AidB-like acyl-CoA dehydrogenase
MRINQFAESVGPDADRWGKLQHDLAAWAGKNEEARQPTEQTLARLHDFGLFRAVLPRDQGGWGVGLSQRDPLGLWTINRRIGFVDASIAHCLQVHNNALDLVFDFGNQALKARARKGIMDGDIFAAWGASRFEALPWVARHEGPDNYVVNGNAFFCTNAGFANHALIMAACPEDAATVPYNGLIIALIDVTQPGVKILPEWWNNATGMIATASHRVQLSDIRFSREDIVVDGLDVQKHHVQTRFMPQFASNFLGMIEHVLVESRDFVGRTKTADQLARARLGQLSVLAARVEIVMREAARVWFSDPASAPWIANVYRSEAGHALIESLDHGGILLGGGGMMSTFAFSKVVRDAMTMLRHENTDRIVDTLGSLCLGATDADLNYSGRLPVKV